MLAHPLQVMTESVRLCCQLLMLDKNKPPLHQRLINAEELTQLTTAFDDRCVSEQQQLLENSVQFWL